MPSVLITGASRGIGRATALAFAKAGWWVAANYNHSHKEAMSLVEEIKAMGGTAIAIQCDVSDYDACASMINRVRDAFGHIDALVNNAGVSCDMLFTDTSPEVWRRTFSINVDGAYNCCHAVLGDMISRKQGAIVNVSSIWGVTGGSCEVAYSASKAALIGLTKALAKEMGPSNIRVNCVAPGVIDTDMNRNLTPADIAALSDDTPLCRIGTPEDVAETILFLASSRSSFITGAVIGVNGGLLI
ncbi:MAG: 3-oxoacyl-ACP reductase FabG [Clostridia bacterium]|nr:3-oxoacyl-ACP reductase FabG [Clostridia bacterium]